MKALLNWIKSLSLGGKILLGLGVIVTLTIASGSNSNSNFDTSGAEIPTPISQIRPSAPVITTKLISETQIVPFTSSTINDATITKGTTKITTIGVNGSETLNYEITYKDGLQTDKKLLNTVVDIQPINQVTSTGTYVARSNCDPNYSGACVPIASDVDCLGGSGNGPAYIKGPVIVIGSDIYGLDRDGNGIGCE